MPKIAWWRDPARVTCAVTQKNQIIFHAISYYLDLFRTKKLSEAQVVAKQEINKMRNQREEELQREMEKVRA